MKWGCNVVRGKTLIHNGNRGRNLTLPALDVPLSEVRATFEANFFSVVLINQHFVPLLIRAAPSLIINIGSVAAIIPYIYSSIYNASKAALHAYSDTLRLELEPFNVRVLVAVTGGVKSNIARTERLLPENSLYTGVEREFEERVKHSQRGAMTATEYAKGVVQQALRKEPGKWYWRGNMAHAIKWAWRLGLGSWLFGRYMRRIGGLLRLKEMVARKMAGNKKVL
jgi:1-acylglycerone phosphate reductase